MRLRPVMRGAVKVPLTSAGERGRFHAISGGARVDSGGARVGGVARLDGGARGGDRGGARGGALATLRRVKHVDFFYDFACPYAYLAHERVDAACARHGATVRWRPFLLGGVFRAIGTPDLPAAHMPASKARMNLLDMHRWAAFFGVPFQMPPTHPNRTVLALRAAIASGDLERASKALFAAYWAEGLDASQPAVVRAALDRAGFDGAALVARAEEPAIKEALRAATDEAIAAGVFGAPAFVVTIRDEPGRDDAVELFWGQDRLVLVEEMLAGGAAAPEEEACVVGRGRLRRGIRPRRWIRSPRAGRLRRGGRPRRGMRGRRRVRLRRRMRLRRRVRLRWMRGRGRRLRCSSSGSIFRARSLTSRRRACGRWRRGRGLPLYTGRFFSGVCSRRSARRTCRSSRCRTRSGATRWRTCTGGRRASGPTCASRRASR
jgi:2-hydroxychromene-2-carboxylate isomerase